MELHDFDFVDVAKPAYLYQCILPTVSRGHTHIADVTMFISPDAVCCGAIPRYTDAHT